MLPATLAMVVAVHGAQASVPLAVPDEIVSRTAGGTLGNGGTFESAISGDGRYVAFTSGATNLVADANGVLDVFVFDRVANSIQRASVAANGTEANGSSAQPTLTPDGRFIAFISYATNLSGVDSNGTQPDVFVKDLGSGAVTLVSLSVAGTQLNLGCVSPDISDDGLRIAMLCTTSPGTTQILVRDRGTAQTRVIPDSTAAEADFAEPAISGNGRHVAFLHPADADIWIHDLTLLTNSVASVGAGGLSSDGPSEVPAALSFDGCHIAFASLATNLAPQSGSAEKKIFVRNRCAGTTELVSLDANGSNVFADSSRPSISADGRYVAFHSAAADLAVGSLVAGNNVIVRDRRTPGAISHAVTHLLNGQTFDSFAIQPAISDDGQQVAAQVGGSSDQIAAVGNPVGLLRSVEQPFIAADDDSFAPVVSGDGNLVVFASEATGFFSGWNGIDSDGSQDATPKDDVFVHDAKANCMEQASMNSGFFNSPCFSAVVKRGGKGGAPSNDCSAIDPEEICSPTLEPTIASGRMLVAFVAADASVGKLHRETKRQADARRKTTGFSVYLRNLVTGTLQRAGPARAGGVGTAPRLSADGTSLVFVSPAGMTGGDSNGGDDIYRVRIKPNPDEGFEPNPDCVSCKDEANNTPPPGSGAPIVTANGNIVAFSVPNGSGGIDILLRNLVTGTSQRVGGAGSAATRQSTAPSVDYSGNRLVFTSNAPLDPSDTNGRKDVYVFEPGLAKLTLVTRPATGQSNEDSGEAVISGDGRTISYTSMATNLSGADADTNGVQDVFVQQMAGPPVRLGRNRFGRQTNAASRRPTLDYSGSSVLFDSDASNLLGEGFDPNPDTGLDVYRRSNPVNPDGLFVSGFE